MKVGTAHSGVELPRSRGDLRATWISRSLIALAGIIYASVAFYMVTEADNSRVQAVLETRVDWRTRDIEHKLLVSAAPAEALAAYLAVEDAPSMAHFHNFARRVHHSGSLYSALTWYPLLADRDRSSFVAAARGEVSGDYDVREISPDDRFVPAARRDTYLPSVYEQAFDDVPGVIGFDLLFRPASKARVERIRDEGTPLASPPFKLLLGGERIDGFIVLFPVYTTGTVPQTVDERRAAFRGAVVARYRFDRLLPAAIANTAPIKAALDISIAGNDGSMQRIASFDPVGQRFILPGSAPTGTNDAYQFLREFSVFGKRWAITHTFPPEFVSSLRSSARWAWVAAGLLMTAFALLYNEMVLRRRRQAALQMGETEQAARGIIQSALDAIIQMDESGTVIEWNPQAEAVFGWSREEAVGQLLSSLIVPPAYRDRHQAGLARFLATGEGPVIGKRFEIEALHRDGREFKVELAITARRRRTGYEFNGFIRDLTQHLAIEEQLRQAQKMEAIGNLTGGMAHDFNNLLGIIIGNLDLLRDHQSDDAEIDELTGEALDAALHGADLIRQLLAFARRQPLQPKRTDVNELVTGISGLLKRTLREDIEITLQLGTDVWSVIVDPAQLEASLLNLANNARDAMPNGGHLVIATSNRHLDQDYASRFAEVKPGDYALIEVSDTGTGMSPEVLNRIFEPFYTTKAQGKGTGLGLSMVFGFMKQSGGHVNVYSEAGIGTTFRLYLPNAQIDAEATAVTAPEPVVPGSGETVLVVEDNAGLRRVVVRQLTELGYRPLEAEDAQAALRLLESEVIDLLFTDIVMPGGTSGYELARTVQSRWPQIKVVLTSGFPEGKVNGDDRPLNIRLLSKPYRRDDLARIIREILD